MHTPCVTASDCEGAGEMFQVTTLLSQVLNPPASPSPSPVSHIEVTLPMLRLTLSWPPVLRRRLLWPRLSLLLEYSTLSQTWSCCTCASILTLHLAQVAELTATVATVGDEAPTTGS